MLLSLMRKHAKSWLIKFLIGMIAIVFIFYFGYSFTAKEGIRVAYVNGEVISGWEFKKTYDSLVEGLQREYKHAWNDKLIEIFNLKKKALENLINQKLISQEARRLGLDITEKEIQREILSYPAFQFKGRFDQARYRSLLHQNRMKPEDFETIIAQDLLQKKVDQFLKTFLAVSDQEVLDQYRYHNQKIRISFVRFSPEQFKESVQIDEPAMEKYFQEKKEKYRIPEKVKLAYIVIDPEEFRNEDQARLTGEEVSDYYDENLELFQEEKQVSARHILFKLGQEAPPEEEKRVKEKARGVLERARKGEDFASLAREYSEGPTGKDGGDLGFFSSGEMVKPFEEAAFKMKTGEISDLVRTPFGYHIIKVEDVKEARTKPLEEVREKIEEMLINTATSDLAHEKALSLIDQMPYDADLAEYASDHKVPLKQTDYFSQNEPIPEIEGDAKVREVIFSLKKNEVSDLIETDGKFYIIQVVDGNPSRLPELSEVRDEVKGNYVSHLSVIEAKSAAEEYLEELKGGKAWDELARRDALTPEMTDFFTRNDPVPQIGYQKDLLEAAFSLDEENRYADKAFENDTGVFVIRWEGQQDIDQEEYLKGRERYRSSLARAKHRAIFGEWLESLREKADIEIVRPVDS